MAAFSREAKLPKSGSQRNEQRKTAMNLTNSNAGNFGKSPSISKETTMNLTTIANIPSSNWKRIKGQYFAAAAGIALAVSAALVSGVTSSGSVKPASVQPRAATASTTPARPVTPHAFYIVADEQQGRELLETLNAYSQLAMEDGYNMPQTFSVVLAGPQAEMLHGASPELMAAMADVRIIDLTQPGVFFAAPLQRVVSDADIAAGVLSTELATYGVPVEPREVPVLGPEFWSYEASPAVARASEADIAASVLSTELANYAVPTERVASEADIAAGVLSSELAHFGR
jgi:hypothetical protein